MKEKRSPEEIAFGEWLKKQIDESEEELDFFKPLSKMEIPPPETFMVGKPNSAYHRRRNIRRVAVVLVLVLGCTFACTQLFAPEQTTATKVKTGEHTLNKQGIVYDTERVAQGSKSGTFIYTEESDFEIARKKVPQLKLPQSTPIGFNFSTLELKLYEGEAWRSRLTYKNETGEDIAIVYHHYSNAIDIPSFEDVVSSEKLDDGKVVYNIYDAKNDRNMVVCVIDEFDKVSISSYANVDFSELKEIILNMK